MKDIKYLIIVFCLLAGFKSAANSGSVIIQGVVKNSVTRQVAILKQDCRYFKKMIHHDTLDAKGKFRMEFEIEASGYFTIRLGEIIQILFLSPGDSLNVKCNMREGLHSLRIEGSNLEVQKYLIEYNIAAVNELDYEHHLAFEVQNNYKHLSEDKIIESIDSISESRFKRLGNYIKILPKSFSEMEFQRLKFSAYIQKIYCVESIYKLKNSKIAIDQRFYELDKANTINFAFDKDEYIHIPSYLQASFEKFRSLKAQQSYDTLQFDNNQKADFDFKISETFMSGLTLHYLRYMIICNHLSNYKTQEEVMPYLHLFMKSDAPEYMKVKTYTAFTDHYSTNELYYFTNEKFLDANNNLRSLSEFKGKYIVLGYYSNLTPYPAREYRFLKNEFKDIYKDHVAFIHINIDNEYKNWQLDKKLKNPPGEYWWVSKNKSDLYHRLKLRYLNSVIIIDRTGSLIYYNLGKLKFELYNDAFEFIVSDINNKD